MSAPVRNIETPRDAQRRARLATAIVMAILLALLWLHVLRRPLPLPSEEGVEVISMDEVMQGTQPQQQTPPPKSTAAPVTPEPEEEPLLEGEEEIPKEIVQTPEPQPQPEQPTEETKPQPTEQPQTEKPTETPDTTTASATEETQPAPKPDPRVLFPAMPGNDQQDKAGRSEGEASQSSSPRKGRGQTEGFSFDLAGRDILAWPRINDRSNKEGIVVVEIVVDPSGRVVSARPGVRGSTTTDPYLLKLAKDAALKTQFTAAPNRATDQIGTLTIHFKLR